MTWMQSTVWNCKISNPSRLLILGLFDSTNFCISSPQCFLHYMPDISGVLNNAVHHRDWFSEVIIVDILHTDHRPIILIGTREETSVTVEKLADWELFQSLFSEITSPDTSSQIHSFTKTTEQHVPSQFLSFRNIGYLQEIFKFRNGNTKYLAEIIY
jgi:hypothetical protein